VSIFLALASLSLAKGISHVKRFREETEPVRQTSRESQDHVWRESTRCGDDGVSVESEGNNELLNAISSAGTTIPIVAPPAMTPFPPPFPTVHFASQNCHGATASSKIGAQQPPSFQAPPPGSRIAAPASKGSTPGNRRSRLCRPARVSSCGMLDHLLLLVPLLPPSRLKTAR
jgi:hypothetical protein